MALSLLSLFAIQGISESTGQALVSYELSKLPSGEHNLTINSSQVVSSPQESLAIGRYLESHLQGFVQDRITPEIIYSELSDQHGVRFYFGAVDDLGTKIHLLSGRLPRSCASIGCEVIQVGGERKLVPRPTSLGLQIVGFGEISGNQIFAGTMGPPQGTALLLANGVAAGTSLAPFANTHGSNGWVGKIDLVKINQVGTEAYASRIVAFEDHLSIDYPNLIVSWPQDALSAASDQAASVSTKLTLLNFAVVALLLAFLSLVALRQRKNHVQFRTALSRIGTPKRSLAWEVLLESAAPIILGAFIAAALSPLLPRALALFNLRAGWGVIYLGWPRYLLLGAVGVALIVGLTLARDVAWRSAQIMSCTAVLFFFGLYLKENQIGDWRYLTTPLLYAMGPVVLCYLALRAITSLSRNKKREIFIIFREFFVIWQGVAAMVALAALLAMLALGYSSGLSQETTRQSRNQVPLDISLSTGSDLIRPLDLASVGDYQILQPGSVAFPVLRTGTSIRGQSSTSDSLALVGLPAGALALTEPTLGSFAKSKTFLAAAPESGIAIGSTKTIEVTLLGIPKQIDLLGWFVTARGTHFSASFLGQGATRTLSLYSSVPSDSALVAFELRESSNYLSRRLHAIGEGNYSVPQLTGTGSITKLLFDGAVQTLPPTLWKAQNFPFLFDGQSIYIQPKRDLGIPSVLTDPVTASLAVDRLLTLSVSSNRYMQVRVGAIRKSFPSAGERFVVMSLGAMQSEIAQTNLGAVDPIEIWIKSPASGTFIQKLNFSPYKGLVVKSRLALERLSNSDPTSIGLLGSYRVVLTLALLISLLTALGALPLLYKEGREVLVQLELVGAGPRSLRGAVRFTWRTAALVGLGVGTALGILIARVFISSSIPVANESTLVLGSSLFVEICGRILSRKFFSEKFMVR